MKTVKGNEDPDWNEYEADVCQAPRCRIPFEGLSQEHIYEKRTVLQAAII